MSNKIDDGGPAFPTLTWERLGDEIGYSQVGGLTLRDYFAAKAMQGSLAFFGGGEEAWMQSMTVRCYAIADAMLAAREATR